MLNSTFYKTQPEGVSRIIEKPNISPVFVTIDWRCHKFIKDRHGICLYFKNHYNLSIYDFSFCYQREVWVVYSKMYDNIISMRLGRTLQLLGAKKY